MTKNTKFDRSRLGVPNFLCVCMSSTFESSRGKKKGGCSKSRVAWNNSEGSSCIEKRLATNLVVGWLWLLLRDPLVCSESTTVVFDGNTSFSFPWHWKEQREWYTYIYTYVHTYYHTNKAEWGQRFIRCNWNLTLKKIRFGGTGNKQIRSIFVVRKQGGLFLENTDIRIVFYFL